jgi:hypothetical protein
MLPTMMLLAALSAVPAQSGGLTLADARLTHGIMGPPRANAKFLPGDTVFLAYDIDGITVDPEGKALYTAAIEVRDSAGKAVVNQKPQDEETVAALGGTRLPAYAQVTIGVEQPAGEYTLKLTVTDRASKKTAALDQKFEVLARDFGIARLLLTGDPEGRVPSGLLGTGQEVFVNAMLIGFKRDGAMQQPNVRVELRVLDENGKPTLAKPFAGEITKDVPAKEIALPVQFVLGLNRPGKFTVEMTASDRNGNKKATQSFPITVYPSK